MTTERNEAQRSENEAIKARNAARTAEQAAIAARNDARREAKQNLRRLVRMAVDNGNRVLDEGNPLLALPWYVHALKNEPDGPAADRRHRVRLASVLAAAPRLKRLNVDLTDPNQAARRSRSTPADPIPVPRGHRVTQRVISPDGKRILVTSAPFRDSPYAPAEQRQGTAGVWNAASGKPVFPALVLPYRIVDGLFLDGGGRILTVMEIESPGARAAPRSKPSSAFGPRTTANPPVRPCRSRWQTCGSRETLPEIAC